MQTEKITVSVKDKPIAEVEIERFQTGDFFESSPEFGILEKFFENRINFYKWFNKVYEAEVIRQTKKAARTPKVPKELLPKLRKRLMMDEKFLKYVAKKVGVELE